ncbi:MAG: DUF1501 domain-containing protein [Planctomycetota bacterium]|jgi:hypothetical protein
MLDLQAGQGMPFCDGFSRRTLMQAGALGTLGLGLPQLLSQQAAQAKGTREENSRVFGRAKRVILLFMWGGPAHQDTWDLKPDGPVESRGEFLPISTNVPGLHISEHFPLIAQHADKLALIRSVGQEDNNHSTGAHAGLTGRRHELKAESFGARETDFPHFGSVLSSLRPNRGGLPTFVSLPEVIATTNGAVTPGQGGGLIGRRFDPFRIDQHPDEPDFSIDSLKLPQSVGLSRLENRRGLLHQLDSTARLVERSNHVQTLSDYYQQAMNMVLAPEVRRAFDIDRIPEADRMRYGYHTFGQSVLMAKRLVEAGVQLVTVYWHREKKTVDSTWDTHALNFQELKLRLMPSVDRPIAALLEDLAQSGLLEDTLVVWNSEFGRTPKVNARAGRDHWGPCNSVVMAGAGVPGGQVYGASDKQAAYPIANKVTQDDIAATIYHLLGLHPETEVVDRLDRPHRIALGEPIYDVLGGESRVTPTPDPEPITDRPQLGAFTRLLRERGNRHLTCNLGNPDSEAGWKLTGWSEPSGTGLNRHRSTGESAVSIEYGGFFYTHFDYGYLVLRLAEPRSIGGVTLTLAGSRIAIPDGLLEAGEQTVWQIPFPPGMVKATSKFDLKIEAKNWPVTDVAVVGDEIRELHLRTLETAVA